MSRRKKNTVRDWKLSVPEELALRYELLFFDPINKRINYGARSALIVRLLQDHWNTLPAETRARVFPQPSKET